MVSRIGASLLCGCFLITNNACATSIEGRRHDDVCYSTIESLAEFDASFGTRIDQKRTVAAGASTAQEFAADMQDMAADGVEWACGYTAGWINELLFGLEDQFVEFKEGEVPAGFEELYGTDLIQLFEDHADLPNRVIYTLRQGGSQDHVWIVEKLPGRQDGSVRGSYRVYQSYHWAYSLKAWLAEPDRGDEMLENGNIVGFDKFRALMNEQIKAMSGGAADLYHLDDLPAPMAPLRPFAQFVVDYTDEDAVNNFATSRRAFGGRMRAPYFFSEYLARLGDITGWLREHDNTDELFSPEVYSDWQLLFGSPDPTVFPNLPANIVTHGKTYWTHVRAVVVPLDEDRRALGRTCAENGEVLWEAVQRAAAAGGGDGGQHSSNSKTAEQRQPYLRVTSSDGDTTAAAAAPVVVEEDK